ncbi:MAG: hypothetical protein KA004_14020 [Verrucomicrobiales bacterium]|nr:hypothetical protein [Verrucomicrobiales bacterium]
MKRHLIFLALTLGACPVWAQQTAAEKAKAVLAAERAKAVAAGLDQAAGSRANLERIRKENERRLTNSQITAKEHAAIRSLLNDVDQDSLTDEERKRRVADFLKDATPQVRELFLTKKDSAETTTPQPPKPSAPVPGVAPGKPGPPVNFANVPVPPKKEPPPKGPKKKAPAPLTIDANELLFRQDSKVAVFKGRVKLRSPQMDIDSEELEVLFKDGAFDGDKEGGEGAKPGTPPADGKNAQPGAPKPPASGAVPGAGTGNETKTDEDKIEKAWARGRGSVVTIVRRSPQKLTVCKCGEAIYEAKTGNLTLKQNPEIQEGGKAIYALDPGTILILDKEGTLQANGRVGTRAVEEKNAKPPAAAPVPDAAPGRQTPPVAKPTP